MSAAAASLLVEREEGGEEEPEMSTPDPYNDDATSESEPLVTSKRTNSKFKKTCRSVGKWFLTNLLLVLTVVSVVGGFVLGLCIREADIEFNSDKYHMLVQLLSFPGEIFLRMLKMLILPLIVFSLIAGLGSLETKVAGSLGWKTIAYYFTTTTIAIATGMILVVTIKPGNISAVVCDNSTHGLQQELDTRDSILDLMRNVFPDNLFVATFQQSKTEYFYENVTNFKHCMNEHNESIGNLTCIEIQEYVRDADMNCSDSTRNIKHINVATRDGMNILGIIVFVIGFGIVLGRLGEDGRAIVKAISTLNEAIMKLVIVVMWYSPIGIASIIAGKMVEVEDFGVLIAEIGLYTATVLVGLILHGCVTLPLIYIILTRRNPLKILKAVLQALLTAFGTSSSSVTLPITIQNLEDNFNSDPRVTRFMLPIGATINMDGTALYEAVAAVFIAQIEGVPLTAARIIIISITATFASIGAAGIPQAGLFTLVIVLVAVGLDPENVALILAVDWLLDRFRTTVNVMGDSFGVGIVEFNSRKQLSAASAENSIESSQDSGSSNGRLQSPVPSDSRWSQKPSRGSLDAQGGGEGGGSLGSRGASCDPDGSVLNSGRSVATVWCSNEERELSSQGVDSKTASKDETIL